MVAMCRNITPLRGLEPPATPIEIEAAAIQYARKVAAITTKTAMSDPAFTEAVRIIAQATADLIAAMPPRRVPPKIDPPLRRIAAAKAASA